MAIGDICSREVVVAGREMTAAEAAHLMRQQHTGTLVVVDQVGGRPMPAGLVTDRDIVLSVVATGLDPTVFTLGDLVFEKLITCDEDQGIFETIQLMRTHGIRRVPVVKDSGELVGIVSVDDVVKLLAEEMAELGKLIERERAHEVQTRK